MLFVQVSFSEPNSRHYASETKLQGIGFEQQYLSYLIVFKLASQYQLPIAVI